MAFRAISPEFRSVRRLVRQSPDSLLQPYPTTTWHRHPALFNAVKGALAGLPEPKLLSYGCSTGEEALSLAELMPNATITAIDINPRSIEIARRRTRKLRVENVQFFCAGTPPAPETVEPFDAIFCLSVLRHARLDAECPDTCAAILPFARVQMLLHRLDDLLRPGGYLVLWGSNFRIRDTDIAGRYTWIPVAGYMPHPGPFYGSDDQRLDVENTPEFLFRKEPAAPPMH